MVREYGYRLFGVTISDKGKSCWCHSAGAFKTPHTSSLSPALTQLVKEGRKVVKEIKPQRKGRWSRMKNPLAQTPLSSPFGSPRDLLLHLKGVFCFLEGLHLSHISLCSILVVPFQLNDFCVGYEAAVSVLSLFFSLVLLWSAWREWVGRTLGY